MASRRSRVANATSSWTVRAICGERVEAAHLQDRDEAKALLSGLPPMVKRRLSKIWADGAYNGDLAAWCLAHFHIVLELVQPVTLLPGVVRFPRRWVVERTFAWLQLPSLEQGL